MEKNKIYFIMCSSCNHRYKVKRDDFPRNCPFCKKPFHRRVDSNESITDVLYNILVNDKPERGFYYTDPLGWIEQTEDNELLMPSERL